MSIQLSNSAQVDHVVVAGYGRNGRATTRVLRAADIPFVLAEWNHAALSDGY